MIYLLIIQSFEKFLEGVWCLTFDLVHIPELSLPDACDVCRQGITYNTLRLITFLSLI